MPTRNYETIMKTVNKSSIKNVNEHYWSIRNPKHDECMQLRKSGLDSDCKIWEATRTLTKPCLFWGLYSHAPKRLTERNLFSHRVNCRVTNLVG